jgi:hypothetical protein
MIEHDTLLVTLVKLVGRVPSPPPAAMRRRGRPPTYPDRLFLQALVMMIVQNLHTVNELLSVLAQPMPEMQTLRALLTAVGYCRAALLLRSVSHGVRKKYTRHWPL